MHTLVLAGQKEPKVVRDSAHKLATVLPNAREYLISDADHAYLFAFVFG
ncbi:MAG: hypothetical protein WB392_05620 [Methanotrichaceae archaeon]